MAKYRLDVEKTVAIPDKSGFSLTAWQNAGYSEFHKGKVDLRQCAKNAWHDYIFDWACQESAPVIFRFGVYKKRLFGGYKRTGHIPIPSRD